jgi:hypothetical protein
MGSPEASAGKRKRTAALIDASQAHRLLELLGKKPSRTRLRAFAHKHNPDRRQIGARSGPFNLADAARWQRGGRGIYFVVNHGGDDADSITDCLALFAEWDGIPEAEQLDRLHRSGMPQPTATVSTSGGSLHIYWRLRDPISPAEWKPAMRRLIAHLGSDPKINDPSRVMRLPGCAYIGRDGTETGRVEIIDEAPEAVYSLAELLACLPELEEQQATPQPPSTPPAGGGDFAPRSLDEIRAALDTVPRRVAGHGSYETYRRLLCGLIAAVEEAGGTEQQAIDWMEEHSPSASCGWDVAQVARSSTTREAATFWAILRDEFRYDLKRRRRESATSGHQQPQQQASGRRGNASPPPEPEARQKRQPETLDGEAVRQRLEQAINTGIGGADLELLQQQLAEQSELHPLGVARITEAVRREIEAAAAIDAEAHALAIEADRQQIAAGLTTAYLLPAPIAEAIDARTRYMPVSGPSAVLMFLAGIAPAARLGSQVVGSAASGLIVPANLYAAAVARSGAMKSPASRALIREPLEPLQVTLRLDYHRRMESWREQCRATPRGEERPPEPQPSHLIASDPTGEALVATLQQNEIERLGLLLHRDELAGLFGGLNQYRGGRGNDRELLLELFDGAGLAQLRVVGGGRFFTRSQFSIYGTIQPEVLRQLVAEGDPSGLWARFLFAPLPAVAVRLPDDDDDTETQAAIDTLRRVTDEIHRLTPRPYRLDAAGAARFRDYHYERQQAALAATLPAHGALYGKAAGKVLRVAGLLHLAAIGAKTADEAGPIPDATVERAVMLVDHLDAYALGIHADAAGSGPSSILRTVHRIAEAAGKALSVGEVRQKLSKAQRQEIDSHAITQAMHALARANYGEVAAGGRGAIRYGATGSMP